MQSSEIKNFLVVTELVAAGGQPQKDQIEGLCQEGYKVVINLGLSGADYSVYEEENILARSGVFYFHIPVNFKFPKEEQFLLFFEYMNRSRGSKIFVHCAANKRAVCFLSLWCEICLGWSRIEASDLVGRIWEPNEEWSSFMNVIRQTVGNRS